MFESFSPSSGVVIGIDQKPVLAAPTTIPCDSVLGLGDFHSNRSVEGIVSAKIVDEFFNEDKYGPIRQAFPIADILAVLHGDAKAVLTAKHDIRSIRGFGFANTITETTASGVEGLGGRPLLAMAMRLYFVKDFVHRLRNKDFYDMLLAKSGDYLAQLESASEAVRAIGTGQAGSAPTELVREHLAELTVSLGRQSVSLNPPQSMLTPDDGDNGIFALACPIEVDHEPFPVAQREILLDRLETEKQLVQAHVNQIDVVRASETMSSLATESMKSVFQLQEPFQRKFLALQQVMQPGPDGKVGTPFRVVNRPLSALVAGDGKLLKELLKDLPGRRAVDFSNSIDTIAVLDEFTTPQQFKEVGLFAQEVRAIVVAPVHVKRRNAEAAAIHPSQFPNLHGVRSEAETWKRYIFPVAGSFLADTDNPFLPTVAIPNAAIAAGMMVRHSDTIALPPAGDQRRLAVCGAATTGRPHETLVNSPLAAEMPGINRVVRRTDDFYELHGASTLSGETLFSSMAVARVYNDLIKNISELFLTKLFNTQDTEADRKALHAEIDQHLRSRSGTDPKKPLSGGKVVSIQNALDQFGKPMPGVLAIKLQAGFKYVLYGVEVKIIPEEITLHAENPKLAA